MREKKGVAERGHDEASEFEPWFRNGDDSVVQPHRITTQSRYFWKHWVRILGMGPAGLLMRLRMACYYNPETGEERDFCNLGLLSLAAELGVNERTIRRWLEVLVASDFIQKKRQNRWSEELGQWVQTTNKYRVKMWDPTVPQDHGKAFVRDIERMAEEATLESLNPAHIPVAPATGQYVRSRQSGPVDNSATGQDARSLSDRTKCPGRRDTNLVTSNVNVVRETVNQRAEPSDCSRHEGLALEIGDRLQTWERAGRGDGFDGRPHQSERFHRLVAARMPEHLIREALMAAADAQQRGTTSDPSRYFGKVVQNIAAREGIELGLSQNRPVNERDRGKVERSGRGDTSGMGASRGRSPGAVERVAEPPMSDEARAQMKAALAEFRASLAVDSRR